MKDTDRTTGNAVQGKGRGGGKKKKKSHNPNHPTTQKVKLEKPTWNFRSFS